MYANLAANTCRAATLIGRPAWGRSLPQLCLVDFSRSFRARPAGTESGVLPALHARPTVSYFLPQSVCARARVCRMCVCRVAGSRLADCCQSQVAALWRASLAVWLWPAAAAAAHGMLGEPASAAAAATTTDSVRLW